MLSRSDECSIEQEFQSPLPCFAWGMTVTVTAAAAGEHDCISCFAWRTNKHEQLTKYFFIIHNVFCVALLINTNNYIL